MTVARGFIDPSHGALVAVSVAPTRHWLAELERSERGPLGLSVTRAVEGRAMVDTGASSTIILADVATLMRLPDGGAKVVQGFAPVESWRMDGHHTIRTVHASIGILGIATKFALKAGTASLGDVFEDETQPLARRVIAIIGRDILDRLVMRYDGPTGTFTLTKPAEL